MTVLSLSVGLIRTALIALPLVSLHAILATSHSAAIPTLALTLLASASPFSLSCCVCSTEQLLCTERTYLHVYLASRARVA
jgi:hypothetical protein